MSYYRIAASYPGSGKGGALTFAGVLQRYFEEQDANGDNVGISRLWNPQTQANYINDYEIRLLPTLKELFGEQRLMSAYTADDFEECIHRLEKKYHYAAASLEHYRHLIWVVYKAGFEHGHYSDMVFWDDVTDLSDQKVREAWRVETMTRIRKSLSIEEEYRFVKWMRDLDPATAEGEEIGLVLSFWLGLRNNEVCGANYGSIHPLAGHPELSIFDMVQSTVVDSNELKTGGKTSNAPRQLPLLKPVSDLLMRRRKFLEAQVETDALQLPAEIGTVDRLPIACRGLDFYTRASSRDITRRARELFPKLGISKRELPVLFQIACMDEEFKDMPLEEKEPTAYLLRRNSATHLYHLGLSEAEVQYWMGHEIEEPGIRRSFFADPDQLFQISTKMNHHPALVFCETEENSQPYQALSAREPSIFKGVTDRCERADAQLMRKYVYSVHGREPGDSITVNIQADTDYKVSVVAYSAPAEYEKTVQVTAKAETAYFKIMSELANSELADTDSLPLAEEE